MKSYISVKNQDLIDAQRQVLCQKLRSRLEAAQDNPALLEMLARESQSLACDIPELDDVNANAQGGDRMARTVKGLNRLVKV